MDPRTRVLVVDPDRDLTASIAARLERSGHDVRRAASAEEALDLGGFEPAILICELRLPGASGLELVTALHDRAVRPHTVFVTALPTFHDCRRAFKLGAAELLPKPLDLDELERAIEGRPAPSPCEGAAPTELRLRTDATRAGVETAVREVLAFALRLGVAPAARARLAGAVAEVADNVRAHAYDGSGGPLGIQAGFDGSTIELHVSDEGRGFDVVRARLDAVAGARPWREGEPNGLARAAALVEGLSLSSSEHGTRVTLRVSTGRATFDCVASTDLSELDYLDPGMAKRVLRAVQSGRSGDMSNIPPALAVVLGRLLAGPTPAQLAQTSLWS